MKCEELFQKIDELYPKYIKVWEDICNIESPTNYKEGVDAVCRYFVQMADERGWEVEILKLEQSGDAACITLNPAAKGAPVCLSGHMDTVHPVGSFGTSTVRMDTEKIYGPGVIDCKGGCVAAFLAMDALDQMGFADCPVKLILQSDEENSSITSNKQTIAFMCEKGMGAKAFLNTEGAGETKPRRLALERKGILRFRYHVTGKAAHSSRCLSGANAIAEAAYKIIELEKMKNPDGLTCNCGVVEGGTVGNTVAEQCTFVADIRFRSSEEESRARALVTEIANTTYVEGCSCKVEEVSHRPAMEYTEKNRIFLDNINKIWVENGLVKCESAISLEGSDAAYITQAGIPCVDNIGTCGGGIHSTEEYALLTSLAESAKYMAAVVFCLG